jgi:hypothetical protein
MKSLLTLLIALLLFARGMELYAQGIHSAMGEISTVGFDGPFDATRNPALLAQEERKGGLGFTLIYQPYDAYSTTPDAEFKSVFFTTIDRDFVVFDPDTLLLIGGAAFYIRSDRYAFGMSLFQTCDDDKSKNMIRLTLTGPVTSRMYGETVNREMETQSNINFAFLAIPGLSLGAQYQFKYNTSSKVEESVSYVGSTLDSGEKKEDDTTTYTSTLNFGALYRTSSLQLGAIVTAGDYALKQTSYAHLKYNPPPTVLYNISDETSLEGVYNGAPGMVLGCLYSLTRSFAVAGEAGFRIPLEYEENDLSPASSGYVDVDVTTKNSFGYLFSMGAQYRVDSNLILACGFLTRAFSFESSAVSTAGKAEQEADFRLFSARLGLEKKVFDNGYIVLFSAVEHVRISMMMYMEESGPGGLSYRIEISQKIWSLNAGISYIHYF